MKRKVSVLILALMMVWTMTFSSFAANVGDDGAYDDSSVANATTEVTNDGIDASTENGGGVV